VGEYDYDQAALEEYLDENDNQDFKGNTTVDRSVPFQKSSQIVRKICKKARIQKVNASNISSI
jgi:hypothetical protein